MKVITTNLLNRFYKNGVKPIKDALAKKLDTSKVINNLTTTTAGYALDARQGKALDEEISELKSKTNFEMLKFANGYIKKLKMVFLNHLGRQLLRIKTFHSFRLEQQDYITQNIRI